MTITLIGDGVPSVPNYVLTGAAIAREEVERAAELLRLAADVEWVSDLAGLYHERLSDLARIVTALGHRVAVAETAVNTLARLS
jgi:hypothetical protein